GSGGTRMLTALDRGSNALGQWLLPCRRSGAAAPDSVPTVRRGVPMSNLCAILAFVVIGLAPQVSIGAEPTPARGENSIPDPAWLRDALEPIRDKHHLPALAAALVVDGKVVAASAVGVR